MAKFNNLIFKKIMEQSEPKFWGLTLMDIIKLLTIFAGGVWIYATFGSRLAVLETNQLERKTELEKYKIEVSDARKQDKAEYKELLQDIKRSIDLLREDLKDMRKGIKN